VRNLSEQDFVRLLVHVCRIGVMVALAGPLNALREEAVQFCHSAPISLSEGVR